ncbi:serine O-acetyltransferase [Aristaeella hokkaidonensis]|uniref:Serine acetyltransferase n=1 Tax=Aristaeella hokkaidonensis TaxID=3046382 RepID=A0AC61MVF1_9FIRM|nr:serine O-acetyltransferase [Aristaeella hokkaidonensis]QUC66277.1 serine acetyltransferase [Aristaeella hokkaidonensis]SNT94315.1 serine O-acetyltransferase [Aristaeella hokkaidonensis]
MKEHIKSTVKALAQVKMEKARCADHACPPPDRLEIVKVLHELQSLLFPMAFRRDYPDMAEETLLIRALYRLRDQLVAAMRFQDLQGEDPVKAADAICTGFAERLPEIKRLLLLDVEALYEGDPAAVCREEVMITYPGFRAICIFRIAHELYVLKAPLIPRIMTEYAHEKTGIDIHPGATVGEYFFIDHGTGIVIGETTVIGDHVKLYQGVTLGAKSFELDENGNPVKNIKRHPNIGNHVVIYANATILGGDTYIGDNSVIGGNTWLTRSVEAGSVVAYKGENRE